MIEGEEKIIERFPAILLFDEKTQDALIEMVAKMHERVARNIYTALDFMESDRKDIAVKHLKRYGVEDKYLDAIAASGKAGSRDYIC